MTTLAAADTTQPKEKQGVGKGQDVAAAADETTVGETKAPKKPKEPKEPKPVTQVTAQVNSNQDATGSKKASTNEKKANKRPKAGTDSSSTPKNDNKGAKKGKE